jgi:hypothetical protein
MVFRVYTHKSQATIAAMGLKVHGSPLKMLSILQILLVCLSLATATTIVGTAANIYHTYASQHASNPWWLPLWGAHFNTLSLKASIGTATGVVFLNLIFLVLALVAKVPEHFIGRSELTNADKIPGSSEIIRLCSSWRLDIINSTGRFEHRTL